MWKKIDGFPDYSVSDEGQVRRDTRSRGNKAEGRILVPGVGSKGHMYVNLYAGKSKQFTRYIHRLVLEAFVGKAPEGKPCAGHINGDPSDNRLKNLRWVSHAENSQDSIAHGTSGRPGGVNHFYAKLDKAKIEWARKEVNGGRSFRSVSRELGVSHRAVSDAIAGRSYRDP